MKYLERMLTGIGFGLVVLLVWYYFIAGSDFYQLYYDSLSIKWSIFSLFFLTTIFSLAIILIVPTRDNGGYEDYNLLIIIILGLIFGILALAFWGWLIVISFVSVVKMIFVLIPLFWLEEYIIKKIRNKEISKSYRLLPMLSFFVFAIGFYYTPKVAEYQADKIIQNLEQITKQMIIAEDQITIPVESEDEGIKLAKHLFFYDEFKKTSIKRIKPRLESFMIMDSLSRIDTIYYNLVFSKNSNFKNLCLKSYIKIKQIKNF